MLLVGVGLNSSGDPDKASSCWEPVLPKEVRLLVGISGVGGNFVPRLFLVLVSLTSNSRHLAVLQHANGRIKVYTWRAHLNNL